MSPGHNRRDGEPYSDRRQAAQRRSDARRETVYRTRREWLIGEFLIGIASCAAALSGIDGGPLTVLLQHSANNTPWFWLFMLSGSAFILLSFTENRCRSHRCGREVLIRYAQVRFTVHAINMFCWAMAFLWLYFSGFRTGGTYYQALPLAVANCWALVEHAKALWLNPCKAGTTSLIGASFHRFRSAGD